MLGPLAVPSTPQAPASAGLPRAPAPQRPPPRERPLAARPRQAARSPPPREEDKEDEEEEPAAGDDNDHDHDHDEPRRTANMARRAASAVGALLAASAALAGVLAVLGAPLLESADAASAAAHHLREAGVDALLDTLPGPIRESITDSGFLAAFTQSLLLILACELGDRTFFVAAVLAMKAPRIVVFGGAITALALMTILSALMGKAFPMLLDKKYTSIASAILFACFGVQLLRDWWGMRNQPQSENEELAEVEQELSASADRGNSKPLLSPSLASIPFITLLSPIFIKSFSMTALAEWGDRSQIATIALAAAQNIYGVILGGVLGHAICTSLAVVGGRLLATRISEKAVALTGGILFLSFAVLTLMGKLD